MSATGFAPTKDAVPTESLLQMHCAEYEALMTRNTYWITIQFSVAPAIAIYFTLLATVWNGIRFIEPTVNVIQFQNSLLWIGLLGAEAFVLAGYACLGEIYENVRYIETDLRREVEALVNQRPVWMYESYLMKRRGLGASAAEFAATVAAFLAIGWIYWKTKPLTRLDFWLCIAATMTCCLILVKNLSVSQMRLSGFRK